MSGSKRYRGVVIGCGKVGATFEMNSGIPKPASHAAALKAGPRTELAALVDPDPAALKKAAEYYGVPGCIDARECLEKFQPDIAVISTPPGTHEAMLALALERKVPAIICEKPVSDTLEAAQRMIALAGESGSVVIVNHQRRFLPLFRAAREKIAAGALGDIQQITAYYANGLLNNGTHIADALQFLLDDKAAWASGIHNTQNTAAPFGGKNVDGLVGFSKGAVAALQSLDSGSFGIHELRMLGKKGALFIGQNGLRFEWVPVRDGVTFAGVRELDWEGAEAHYDDRSMLACTLAHVVDCLDGAAAPESTLEGGYHTMQILDALLRSADKEGEKVVIE